jgi:hypothetical protein
VAAFSCCENPRASKDFTPSLSGVALFSSYSLQPVLDAVSSAGLSARLVLRKQQWYNAMALHVEM